jgi:hypothetical protein
MQEGIYQLRNATRDNLPSLETALSEVPSPTNRLDVRSGGEGGTTQLRRLGDVGGEQLGRRAATRLILEIDVVGRWRRAL